MPPNAAHAEDNYFNDLSRQPNLPTAGNGNPLPALDGTLNREEASLPRQKRVACVICRKRKLKCDGNRPSCGTCARLGHNCAYDEVRRKSGPKRGYVKELEARLAQVETQLKKDVPSPPAPPPSNPPTIPATTSQNTTSYTSYDVGAMNVDMGMPMDGLMNTANNFEASPSANVVPDIDLAIDENFTWEMIGLGLEEPLPTQEAIDDLTNIYFEKIHPSTPMIHKYRYFAGMNLSPHMRPAVCLRYAMWCNAASVSDRYSEHQEILYRRARKYVEMDEMRGQGQDCVTVAHSQTWSLIAIFEFKNMYFPRAWMSVARAARLALMMGLNRMDGVGIDVKQCLLPPKDWTEREERRRAFWMAYCSDRFASVGTGWPMIVDERDIMSNLPASEQAYQSSTPEPTQSLVASMTPQGASSISSFAGVVFMAHFFGRNLNHLHRPGPDEREHDLQGEFWKRHRNLDNILLHKSLSLPSHLRLPTAIRDSNAIFINMAIHTSTICLHQAAIFKAERNSLQSSLIEQSLNRCNLAATEITNILKLISHLDTSSMNPYMPFCLYVASRVFIQCLKQSSEDMEIRSSLNFLLSAMSWLKAKNPLSESFLIQLGLDIQGSGLDTLLHNPDLTTQLKDTLTCGLGGLNPGGIYSNLFQGDKRAPASGGAPGLPEPDAFFPREGAKPPIAPYGIASQMRTFDVPSAEGRRPPKYPHESGPTKGPSHGVVPPNWSDSISTSKGPSGLFPGGWASDNPGPDVPVECRSPHSNPTPSGLTPSDSHNTSSQTSFSPRPEEARKGSTGTSNDQQSEASSAFFPFSNREGTYMGNQASTPSQDDSSSASYSIQQNQTSNSEAFQYPPGGWNFGSGNTSMASGMSLPSMRTGTTPLPSGMTSPPNNNNNNNSGNNPDWSQMLGSLSWNNSTGPEQGSIDWKQNKRDEPKYGYKSGFFVPSDEPGFQGLGLPKSKD